MYSTKKTLVMCKGKLHVVNQNPTTKPFEIAQQNNKGLCRISKMLIPRKLHGLRYQSITKDAAGRSAHNLPIDTS